MARATPLNTHHPGRGLCLLRTTRLQYHRHRAGADRTFPDTVKTAPELLARHYTQAGMIAESVPCWLRAGERALHASANPEAIAHLTTGLDLLAGLPAGPERAGQELQFRLALGPAYMAIRGYAARRGRGLVTSARGSCVENLATRRSSSPSCTACGPITSCGRNAVPPSRSARGPPAWGCDQRRRATAPGQHGGGLVALLHGRAGAGARASRAGPRAVRP